MSDRTKKIGIKIKLERTKLGYSQDKLAELAGLHKNTIGAIERGTLIPTIATLEYLAFALDMSLEDLIDVSNVKI